RASFREWHVSCLALAAAFAKRHQTVPGRATPGTLSPIGRLWAPRVFLPLPHRQAMARVVLLLALLGIDWYYDTGTGAYCSSLMICRTNCTLSGPGGASRRGKS